MEYNLGNTINMMIKPAQVNQYRIAAKSVDSGIYFVNQDLYRGFDIKMVCDAHVAVLDTDGTLNIRTANQMSGRSARMRGPIQGYNFMRAKEREYFTDWKNLATSRDEAYDD